MEKHIDVSVKASYHTLNELTEETEQIWIVFHGYGMLAQYFIRKFTSLDPEKNFIIAPQGLSKFYLEGFTGRVGSSWMTKEDRLTEIENQQSYLDAIYMQEVDAKYRKIPLTLFGFSQGVATACRFGAYSGIRFDKLVLWAGTFPPDIPFELTKNWGQKKEIIYYTGNQDPFFKEEMIDQQNDQVKKATGGVPKLIRFEGKHEVVSELLTSI